MNETKNLFKKISAVIKKKITVAKDGTNEKQGYKYVTITDIKQEIQKELAEQGMIYFGTVKSILNVTLNTEKQTPMVRAEVMFTLADGETGEQIQSTYFGDGMDYGDKGIYKAYTGAEKYFLIQTFAIATGDDPEDDSKEPEHKEPKKEYKKESEDWTKQFNKVIDIYDHVTATKTEAEEKEFYEKIHRELWPEKKYVRMIKTLVVPELEKLYTRLEKEVKK
jgi:hypothetical protein